MVFLILLAAASSLLAQSPDLSGETGRYLTQLQQKHLLDRAAQISALRSREDVLARQDFIRKTMTRQIGGLFEKTPLRARITGTLARDGYRVEKLVFESLPGFFVTANVYVPTSAKPPFPAVLGAAGHSTNGKASATYQRGWIGLAKKGFLVLAYDPPGQGERSEYFDADSGQSRVGIGVREHMMAGAQCLLTGTNLARYEIWDGIRAFDYLLTRADVDPKRIAVAGNSGGGTQAAYLMVMEPRLAAAAPSCYITAWSHQWSSPGPQDAEQNFVHFLADGLDFPDFLIAFAPKPLKVLTAIRDFFPIDGARQTFAEAKRIYDLLGAEDGISFFEYDDEHGWSRPRREATVAWFSKWMLRKNEPAPEGEIKTELDADLEATPNGQVGGETVYSLNRKLAEQQHRVRAALNSKDLAGLAAKRIAVGERSGKPAAVKSGDSWILTTEGDARIALKLMTPGGSGPKPAVLYLQPGAEEKAEVEAMVKSGAVVAVARLRGWEQVGEGRSGYAANWQNAMRALLVGKTMAGMQTTDVLKCFDFLASRPDVDASRISLIAKGSAGPVALHSAILEARFRRVAIEDSVTSYLTIARVKMHQGLEDVIVPGVLKDYDLPDLARAIGPQRLWIVDPRLPSGARMHPAAASQEYPGFQVRYRPEGKTFDDVYAEWLRML